MDSIVVVRACGVVCDVVVVAGRGEADSIPVARGVVVRYGVVVGRPEVDSFVVVRACVVVFYISVFCVFIIYPVIPVCYL